MPRHILTAILILASTGCFARASFVTFFPPSASQCSNFTLNFTGNQISFPISFLLLPVNSSSPSVVQLPVTAFDAASNSGAYTTSIPFAAGTQFIAVMHDVQGVGNGGVSTVYTVGGSNDTDCLPQRGGDNTLAFSLSPSPPTQCETQKISWTPLDPNSNGDNLKNVNITGYVIGGLAFRLNIAEEGVSNSSSTLWQTSVPQGQDFVFFYERTDPANGTVRRETSAIQTVQPGSNSVCTQGGPSVTPAAVPPSTPNGTTQTSTQTSASTLSPSLESIGNTPGNDIKLPKSALIGIIVGGVCFTAIFIPLIYLFCVRKHRKRRLSPLEDDRQSESRAGLMKISPNAPMGISLPPVRTSVFGLDFLSPARTTALPVVTVSAQGDWDPSPDAARQRGRLIGWGKGRQKTVNSVASWGNKGPLTESIRLEPKPVLGDAMSAISEYSTPDSVPARPPQAVMPISRGGGGPGGQRVDIDEYPRSDNGARSSSSESRDSGTPPAARDRRVQARDYQASEYSPTELSHITPIYTPSAAGRSSIRDYYPAPVQPPSRANPLIQRRLSAYEEDDNYHEGGAGRTRPGAPAFRPGPDGKYGVAL